MEVICEEEGKEGWDKKCSLLKRKCEQYEEMNDVLLTRTKRLHRMIQRAETGKCSLVKRLKQYEVLDEVARFKLAQVLGTTSEQEDERALLATAIKIRGELDAELELMKTAINDGGVNERDFKSTVSNTSIGYYDQGPSHANSTAEPYNFKSPSAPSHSTSTHTPQQSPLASVIVTPTNLVQASIPTPGTGTSLSGSSRTKKGSKGVKVSQGDKQKTRGCFSTKKRKTDADPNAPKKPSNAFFWFCQEKRASLQEQFRAEGVSGQHDLTKALARHWSETNTEDRKQYYHKYATDKARYDQEMEDYSNRKLLMPAQEPETV